MTSDLLPTLLQFAAVALVAGASVSSAGTPKVLSEKDALSMAKSYFGDDRKAQAEKHVAGLAAVKPARTMELSVSHMMHPPYCRLSRLRCGANIGRR